MDDAAGVRVGERVGHVAQNVSRLAGREVSLPLEPRAQRLALDERHGEERQPIGDPRGEHGHDERMLELRRDLDLTPEALEVDAGRELRREHLDHHSPPERVFRSHEHPRHPPTAELALEGVAAEVRLKSVFELLSHCVAGAGILQDMTAVTGQPAMRAGIRDAYNDTTGEVPRRFARRLSTRAGRTD